MSLAAALAGCGAALFSLVRHPVGPHHRLRRLGEASRRVSPPTRADVPRQPTRWALPVSLLAGAAVWLLLGRFFGALTGVTVSAVLAWWFERLEPAQARRERLSMSADLPVALELLSAAVSAGAPVHRALDEVARLVAGPLGRRLEAVCGHVRLGAEPAAAWAGLGDVPAAEPTLRALVRSLESGAAWGPTLERAARDLRHRGRTAAEAAARAVPIKAVLPLGLCFLPAFLLLGVVPTVWSMAAGALAGTG